MAVSIKSNKGFSLVELMVVVAIIGILAAIAIPNFQRFTAKSKQSEAKSNLSALYSAERGFQAEWQLYKSSFTMVGYAPVGNCRYQHGFSAADAIVNPGNYTGPAAVAGDFSTAAWCTQNTGAAGANGCQVVWSGALTPAALAGTVSATDVFLADANGDISAGTKARDRWTINQLKVLLNAVDGLP